MIRVAIVGAGFMGQAHARVIKRLAEENPGLVDLVYVIDVDMFRARYVASRFGGRPLDSTRSLPEGEVDFAIVATPTRTHLRVVEELVSRGVGGFLVEKPMTRSFSEAVKMLSIVEENKLWLSVGHIERFNPAVRVLHRRVVSGQLGDIYTLVSRRVGPYAPRVSDTDVVFDLGIHEVDNALIVYGREPAALRAYTLGGFVSNLVDYAFAVLDYGTGFANIEVNRITPFKQRVLYLTAQRGVLYLDYMNQEVVIHMQDEEVRPRIVQNEPLYIEDLEVISSFAARLEPPVDIYQAFLGIYLCEKILESTKMGKDIVIERDEDFKNYIDELNRGVDGVKRYREMMVKEGLGKTGG